MTPSPLSFPACLPKSKPCLLPMSALSESSLLVVDDIESNRDLLRRHLERQGYRHIVLAENGRQAIELLLTRSFDLIFLDIMMPVMNGFQVLEYVKDSDRLREIPVIAISALDEMASIARCIEMGAEDYLTKPFEHILLKARTLACLEKKRLRDAEHQYRRELEEKNRLLEEKRKQLEEANRQLEEKRIALERLNVQLEEMSRIDGLTGVSNRAYFEEILQREWRTSARNRESFAVIMFDIDFFKQFNDAYGHPVGDECLRQVALITRTLVNRPRDLVARYGGEEFVIVLPDTDVQGAMHIATHLCQSIAALRIPHAYSQVAPFVTVSAGIAAAIATSTLAPSVLVSQADKALYHAKREGRNCVKIWEDCLKTQAMLGAEASFLGKDSLVSSEGT